MLIYKKGNPLVPLSDLCTNDKNLTQEINPKNESKYQDLIQLSDKFYFRE